MAANSETEYLFIYDGEMWWLKLTDAEQIIDYHKKTDNRYEGAIKLYMKFKEEGKEWYNLLEGMPLEERIKTMESKDFKYLQCAIIKAKQVEGTIFDGFRCLNMEIEAGEPRRSGNTAQFSSIRQAVTHGELKRFNSAAGNSLYSRSTAGKIYG